MVAIRVDTAGLTALAGRLRSVAPELRAVGASARRVAPLQQPEVAGPLAAFTELLAAVCDGCADDAALVGRKVGDAAATYEALDLVFGGLVP